MHNWQLRKGHVTSRRKRVPPASSLSSIFLPCPSPSTFFPIFLLILSHLSFPFHFPSFYLTPPRLPFRSPVFPSSSHPLSSSLSFNFSSISFSSSILRVFFLPRRYPPSFLLVLFLLPPRPLPSSSPSSLLSPCDKRAPELILSRRRETVASLVS